MTLPIVRIVGKTPDVVIKAGPISTAGYRSAFAQRALSQGNSQRNPMKARIVLAALLTVAAFSLAGPGVETAEAQSGRAQPADWNRFYHYPVSYTHLTLPTKRIV